MNAWSKEEQRRSNVLYDVRVLTCQLIDYWFLDDKRHPLTYRQRKECSFVCKCDRDRDQTVGAILTKLCTLVVGRESRSSSLMSKISYTCSNGVRFVKIKTMSSTGYCLKKFITPNERWYKNAHLFEYLRLLLLYYYNNQKIANQRILIIF